MSFGRETYESVEFFPRRFGFTQQSAIVENPFFHPTRFLIVEKTFSLRTGRVNEIGKVNPTDQRIRFSYGSSIRRRN